MWISWLGVNTLYTLLHTLIFINIIYIYICTWCKYFVNCKKITYVKPCYKHILCVHTYIGYFLDFILFFILYFLYLAWFLLKKFYGFTTSDVSTNQGFMTSLWLSLSCLLPVRKNSIMIVPMLAVWNIIHLLEVRYKLLF